jgi:cytidyltransferase-like protein
MTIVIATGGFDPIHSGHISYLNEAKKLGNVLYVGVNSDGWLTRKKGKQFMNWEERAMIVSNLKCVDYVIEFDDFDGTAKDAIKIVRKRFPNDTIIFANGGDRTKENIPEMDIVDDNLKFIFGVGGEHKQNSSSWILKSWKN